MDLGAYDEPEAEEALTKVALDASTDSLLVETCAEALAEIWSRQGELKMDVLRQFKDDAWLVATETIKARRPEWEILIESLK